MSNEKFEIHEDDKENLKDIEADTVDSCTSFGFYPSIGRSLREAYRVGFNRALAAPASREAELLEVLEELYDETEFYVCQECNHRACVYKRNVLKKVDAALARAESGAPRGGRGLPGHKTASGDEGTCYCETCVNESGAPAQPCPECGNVGKVEEGRKDILECDSCYHAWNAPAQPAPEQVERLVEASMQVYDVEHGMELWFKLGDALKPWRTDGK